MDRVRRHIAASIPLASGYGRRLLRGVSRYCHEAADWRLTLLPAEYGALRRVDVSVFDGAVVWADNLGVFESLPMPTVAVSGRLEPPGVPVVRPDNREAGRMAGEYLLNRGLRRIVYGSNLDNLPSQHRAAGVAAAMAEAGLTLIEPPAEGLEEEAWAAWLAELAEDGPLGVVCFNDLRGLKLLEGLHSRGVSVPDEVAVIGMDDDQVLCEAAPVALSSVDTGADRIGYQAAVVLADLIRDMRPASMLMELPPGPVISRASTDALAVTDGLVCEGIQYLRTRLNETIGVEDLAEHLGVNRRLLERRFRQAIGRTPYQELLRLRIARVQEHLTRTDQTLAQVARSTGFSSASNLSTAFRKKIGMSPAAYRKQYS